MKLCSAFSPYKQRQKASANIVGTRVVRSIPHFFKKLLKSGSAMLHLCFGLDFFFFVGVLGLFVCGGFFGFVTDVF